LIAKNKDFLSSIFWGILSLGFIWGGLSLGVGSLHGPGPGFIPTIIGILVFILSAALLLSTLLRAKKIQANVLLWKTKGSWKKMLSSLLALLFYMLLLNPFGYLVTTFLFFTYLMKFVSGKGWGIALGVAFLTAVGSYFLFAIGLEVSLPQGIIRLNRFG
jgi:putative tricarboxylic transport membrane protein